jgi:gentisate 1,2-dioxygenase
MNVGDFVITPSWCFHDHGNASNEPTVWLDGLDLPLVEILDAQFMERGADEPQHTSSSPRDNLAQFGNTMRPMAYKATSRTSPLFWYPYERTREALDSLYRREDPHPCWGHKLKYTNPDTGAWAMPTMGTCMQLLPAGYRGKPYRATDSTVYAAVEGKGKVVVSGQGFSFTAKDVLVCPSWMPYTLEADEQAVLFSFSDRPVQEAFDLWREAF